MSRSEPERLTDARRGAADPGPARHPMPPGWYWVLIPAVTVFTVGVPLWGSVVPRRAVGVAEVVVVLLAVVLGVAELRRRSRGEVRLPRIRDFPSVARIWVPVLVVAALPGLAIPVAVGRGQRGVALALVLLVALFAVAGMLLMRRAMHADIAAGRVRATVRLPPRERRAAAFAPGDRVVWLGAVGGFHGGTRLVYSGTFVADGPAPWVTIRHDRAPRDAQVKPERLYRESDYAALVESHGAPAPTTWG